MVFVFGWPDPNTGENSECSEKHVKHASKVGDLLAFPSSTFSEKRTN